MVVPMALRPPQESMVVEPMALRRTIPLWWTVPGRGFPP